MTTGTAIRQGFRLTRRSGSAVWVVFLVNLAIAALAGLPIYRGMLRFSGHSLINQVLLFGFSPDWLTDFSFNNPGALERYAAVIAWLGLLSIPVNSLLAGGVIARFRAPDQIYSTRDFFRSTRRYAWRLLRLMIIGLVCYWITFGVLNRGLGRLIDNETRHWLDDRPVFWLHLGQYALLLFALLFLNLALDFARVKLLMQESSSAVESFLASLGFSLRRLRNAAMVYAVPSLLGIALLVLYRVVTPWSRINANLGNPHAPRSLEPMTLAALFIGQQVIMFGRYWFRIATWASEWVYFRDAQPASWNQSQS
jgi:hypothetical protein